MSVVYSFVREKHSLLCRALVDDKQWFHIEPNNNHFDKIIPLICVSNIDSKFSRFFILRNIQNSKNGIYRTRMIQNNAWYTRLVFGTRSRSKFLKIGLQRKSILASYSQQWKSLKSNWNNSQFEKCFHLIGLQIPTFIADESDLRRISHWCLPPTIKWGLCSISIFWPFISTENVYRFNQWKVNIFVHHFNGALHTSPIWSIDTRNAKGFFITIFESIS